ncbi:MAG TPA: GlsB/YeaQ/YmgE family stress response membrane protein [Thermoanaerobaculia bacterium]|jgi:uncharacterized membrane protein YeaQ/YmgE (transglycosylase-associated protein family)
MEVLWFIVMGAIAGWLAGRVMRGNGFGLLGDIVVGVIGAFIGGYLFRNVGVEIGGGFVGSLLVALAGGLVLLFIVRLITRHRSGPRVWS